MVCRKIFHHALKVIYTLQREYKDKLIIVRDDYVTKICKYIVHQQTWWFFPSWNIGIKKINLINSTPYNILLLQKDVCI